MFILLFSLLAVAKKHIELRRRSVAEHRIVIDEPGFYLVQFRGTITTSLLRRLESVLGYEPRDYIPNNTLLLWIDSKERGEALLRSTPHIYWVGELQDKDRHVDLRTAIDTLRFQYHKFGDVRLNQTGDDTGRAARVQLDAYERDQSGSMVFRLRVIARNVSSEDLRDAAQDKCRTPINAYQASDNVHALHNVHIDDAARVAEALGQHKHVQWVELRPLHHTMNRWGVPTLHGTVGGDQTKLPAFPLRGAEQLVSISDTGIETNTCFFTDAAAKVPFTSVQRVPADTGHRKIRAYWSGTGGDFNDDGPEAGHGTHTSGTLAGSCAGAAACAFSGGAPDSRLVFIDLLPASGNQGFLEVPMDIGATLLQWSSDVGARVHSGSWGGDAGGRYTSDEQSIDAFTYRNRYFLVVFAAGNAGPAAGSISSPAMAKNILSIGATMNGAAGFSFWQAQTRPDDDYSPDWLAPWSSRGSPDLAFRKPDFVVPGAAYMGSASNDGPGSGSCNPLSAALRAMQGTSMAAPLAASGAVLVREYFAAPIYPNRANITGVDTSSPTASLVRAMLISSTVPMRGVYPRQSFGTTQQRIDSTGHGRVMLDNTLDVGTADAVLAVLANEEPFTALAAQRSVRWCVDVRGAYSQMVVAMAYADYPSLPMARATLINDLRLAVTDVSGVGFAINEQPNADELRSTVERALVVGSTQLMIEVFADTIGFGDTQSFSLVLVLRNSTAQLLVSAPTTDKTCTLCELLGNRYLPVSSCAKCGDGQVDTSVEQCDSVPCCDPTRCAWLNDLSPCSVVAGECRLAGTCQGAAGCVLSQNVVYGSKSLGPGGTCQAASPPTNKTGPCVFVSSSTWAKHAENDERQLCCAPLRAAFDQIEFEHLFTLLSREYAAALLNSVQAGAFLDAASLVMIEQARVLLESRCGVGFLQMDERHQALALINELRVINEQCGDQTSVDAENSCVATALDTRLCAGGGVYDRTVGVCLCHSNRFPGEPDCADLACSGAGVSLYDYTSKVDKCVCFAGWSGPDCSQCASAVVPGNIDLVYHCVGIPISFGDASLKHFLMAVMRNTVPSRLAGAYYDSSVSKYSDAVPGQNGFDCWCRSSTELLAWRSMASHRDAVVAALQQRSSMSALEARAEAVFAAANVQACAPQAAQDVVKPNEAARRVGWLALVCTLALAMVQ